MAGRRKEMTKPKRDPAWCVKASDPYHYCPLAFSHQDEMIMKYVTSLVMEIRRINCFNMMSITGADARAIDRYGGQITAYMNGRIHQAIKLKEAIDEKK
jgi:hypothetical protein